MSCALRQICQILLEQATKESLEYIEKVWLAEEEEPAAGGGGRHSEGNMWGCGRGDRCVLHICPLFLFVIQTRCFIRSYS
jgi:hypothetical protein